MTQEVESVGHSPQGTTRQLKHVDMVECLEYHDEAEDDYGEIDCLVDLYLLLLVDFLLSRFLATHRGNPGIE